MERFDTVTSGLILVPYRIMIYFTAVKILNWRDYEISVGIINQVM